MKRLYVAMLFISISFLAAGSLFAIDANQRPVGPDVVRMWKAGVSADTILLFVRRTPVVFTADDVAVMAEAGLPDRFIRDLLKAAGSSVDRRDDRSYSLYYPSRYDYPSYYPTYYGGYPSWFYGGGYLDIHFGGHLGRHHYGSIGHHGTIGHGGGHATRNPGRGSHNTYVSHDTIGRSGGHRFSTGHSPSVGHSGGGGHSRGGGPSGGGHSRGGHSSGGHSGGGHRGH